MADDESAELLKLRETKKDLVQLCEDYGKELAKIKASASYKNVLALTEQRNALQAQVLLLQAQLKEMGDVEQIRAEREQAARVRATLEKQLLNMHEFVKQQTHTIEELRERARALAHIVLDD
jgi:hypothetical protein